MTTFVALHPQLHKHLTIDPARIEAHGAKERMVPVVMSEFLKLVVHYPIVFTKNNDTGKFVCVALLGFDSHENLFWQGNQWQSIYTPLNIMRQPFFIGTENGKTLICIDTDSPCFTSAQGEPLFSPQGEETNFLHTAKQRLAELMNGERETQDFVDTLLALKLIMPMALNITFANQQEQRIQGLYTIDEEQLDLLSAEQLALLQQQRYLKPIYAMVTSLGQLYSLIQKKNERILAE